MSCSSLKRVLQFNRFILVFLGELASSEAESLFEFLFSFDDDRARFAEAAGLFQLHPSLDLYALLGDFYFCFLFR